MIEFFPNKIADTRPLATYTTSRRMSIEDWLKSQAPSYSRRESPPISVAVNGELIDPEEWGLVEFKPADRVQIWNEPKGGTELFIGLLFGAATIVSALSPKMPGMNADPTSSGDPIKEASAKGNRVKLGDPIREVAGFQRIFPSYLLPPTRRYTEPKVQWVSMLLYVGADDYQIDPTKILIGDTPVVSLGDGARYAIYPPGADVSGELAAQWWHQVDEVGSTASNSTGLELTTTTALTTTVTASAIQFNGHAVSIPEGSGEFPDGWVPDLLARVEAKYPYTVIDGGAGRDIIRGDLAMLAPYVGMPIEVAGDYEGLYVVNSYTPYVAPVAASPGTASTLTGSAAPSRYDFNVTPLTFSITRNGVAYGVTLNTATTNLAGLVSALNAALGTAPFQASVQGATVRLTEKTPFLGKALAVTGGSVVFGASPAVVTGTATVAAVAEKPAEMTLDYDGGAPVNGINPGTGYSAIGPRGLLYRILAADASMLTVNRLKADGSTDTSWPGFSFMQSTSSEIRLDQSTTEGDWLGPYMGCPEGALATEIEWDYLFSEGLISYNKNGSPELLSSVAELQYRDSATLGAWTSITNTWRLAERDQIGFSYNRVLPYAMRPEVRVRRVGAKSTSAKQANNIQWTGLRARLAAPASYAGMTTIAVYMRGGKTISAKSESDVSLEATRILPVRSGGAWQPPQATRDIAPWCLSRLKKVGYTDEDLDLEEWDRLDAVWRAAGQTYDETIDEDGTVKDKLNAALACGYAELVVSNGLVRPVRDEPRAIFDREYGPKTQTYSPQNMTEKGLTITGPLPSPNDFDGVDIEYYSSETWAWETVPCRLPGDEGRKVEKVKVPGVSNRDQAYRIGMRRRGHQKYRQDTYTWGTEMAGRNSGYLSFCAVASDTPGLCQSALLLDVRPSGTGFILESSEPLDWSAGGVHKIGIRRLDGTLSGPYIATSVDETRVSIDELDFTPDTSLSLEPPHLLFGPEGKWAYPVLVTSSSPSGVTVSMKGMPYDSRVYDYDNANAPAEG